jgi:hypothetical protein
MNCYILSLLAFDFYGSGIDALFDSLYFFDPSFVSAAGEFSAQPYFYHLAQDL